MLKGFCGERVSAFLKLMPYLLKHSGCVLPRRVTVDGNRLT
jgi:hypothetical protein